VAVLAMKLGSALFGNKDQFNFSFALLAILVFFALLGSIRLPQKAGDSIRIDERGN